MLRVAEYITLALIFFNAVAFLWATGSVAAHRFLELPLAVGFALFLWLVFVAVAHSTPLARAMRPRLSHLDEGEGLSLGDIRSLLKLAPRIHKVIALFGLAGIVVALVQFGALTWSSSSPFEQRHALGIALYVCALSALLFANGLVHSVRR